MWRMASDNGFVDGLIRILAYCMGDKKSIGVDDEERTGVDNSMKSSFLSLGDLFSRVIATLFCLLYLSTLTFTTEALWYESDISRHCAGTMLRTRYIYLNMPYTMVHRKEFSKHSVQELAESFCSSKRLRLDSPQSFAMAFPEVST